MIRFLLAFLILACPLLGADSLKTRLSNATPGDYVVTAQGSNYSLLLVRDLKGSTLLLEEITIPQKLVDLKKVSWKQWVEKKAPGAQSWIALAIDLEKGHLGQIYSYFRHQWMFVNESDQLLAQLLALPLRKASDRERKRIGPAPAPGEADRRKLWKPQLVREGKKQKKAQFTVLRTQWPADKSRLAGCIFDIYLDAKDTQFPFPYWLEVDSPHYTLKIRAVDSGSGIVSPMKSIQ